MKVFNLLEAPLEGTNLIEAAAGTGKTYSLTGLFVRLILEKGLTAGEILVVTYTEAATQELRDRIRKKMREVLQAFTSACSPDPFVRGLMEKAADPQTAIRLLQEAIHDFDQAPIFTIHGFCRRMLQENAFESGILFDTELLGDLSTMEEEIAQDFWRNHFYAAPLEFISYARSKKYSPRLFAGLIRGKGSQPDIRISPEPPPVALEALGDFRQATDALGRAWPAMREDVREKLLDPALNKQQYRNPQQLIDEMDKWLRRRSFPVPDHIWKFSCERIGRYTRKNCDPPAHPFFDLCRTAADTAQTLQAQMDAHLLFLKGELFRYARQELSKRKEKRNLQSFDDLLTRFRASLSGAGGKELAAAVRKKYKAALIDEFQDTDPVQYAIFRNVFDREGCILFLIGDPKQAIYSFRGADLFAYIKAAGHVQTRYTLSGNRRSTPALIDGVNALFSNQDHPFFYKEIQFIEAVPPEPCPDEVPEDKILRIDGCADSPLEIWLLDGQGCGNPDEIINKGIAQDMIAKAVAAEIARLIDLGRSGRAVIGNRPVRESDIAVLCRRNREADEIQQALAKYRIPCVLFSMGNIFDSHEALEMERVLAAVAEPDREELIRAALATEMLGRDAKQLDGLLRNDVEWESVISRFRGYCNTWERHGFIRMFREFLSVESIRTRLLSCPAGERRLTNVLHLAEILHQVSMENRHESVGLVKWLARQRDPETPRLEEHEIRLDSDSDSVKIVTMHKSKGLEYPIVFSPYNWGDSRINAREKTLFFHDREDDWKPTIALDPEGNPNRAAAEEELLAENLRLLYVSLTRAISRCYFVWGRFKGAGTSAPAYLFHSGANRTDPAGDILSALDDHFQALSDNAFREALLPVIARGAGSVRLSALPVAPFSATTKNPVDEETASGLVLENRIFSGLRERSWQVASFSSLVGGRPENTAPERASEDAPDYDRSPMITDYSEGASTAGIFGFPGGAKAGIFFHALLEQLDFTEQDPNAILDLVSRNLDAHGFEPNWCGPVCRMLQDLVSVQLDPAQADLSLAAIPLSERLIELEFYFPLKNISPALLKEVFARHAGPADRTNPADSFPQRIGKLSFQPARGFMKGYIDLVFQHGGRFYLIDWKSNHLGIDPQNYRQEKLDRTIAEAFYFLQYHLYTLALDSYLRMRLPDYDYDRHFGGIYYIFLRGIDPHAGNQGIYRDKPAKALIESLRDCLINEESIIA